MAATATTSLLRIATAGSVDDGKSTLIGRLLHDSKAILADQYEDLHDRAGRLDLSRLTDGLRAEREQGITIDVAYRYFQTTRRKFILADTPGHVQYTRNMVTGASTADLAIVLVDARHGVIEQTKRHAFLAALLGLRHLVVAVNKMDLVGYDEDAFDAIVRDFSALSIGVDDVVFIPLSALAGDNVVDRSESMGWYEGPALLEHLEAVDVTREREEQPARFPVQWVIRDPATDYRGYAGQVAGGVLRAGDEVVVLPAGVRSTIAAIDTYDGPLDEAPAPLSVTVRLADDVDVARGDVIAPADAAPIVGRQLEADVCWMTDLPLRPRARYVLRQATASVRVVVDGVLDTLDVDTLQRTAAPESGLALNDIGRVALRLSKPIAYDRYAADRVTGSFVLVDEATNDTVAAGLIR